MSRPEALSERLVKVLGGMAGSFEDEDSRVPAEG
jgi:hypothetical protein